MIFWKMLKINILCCRKVISQWLATQHLEDENLKKYKNYFECTFISSKLFLLMN